MLTYRIINNNSIISQSRTTSSLLYATGSRRYLRQGATQVKKEQRLPLPAFIRVRDLAKKIKQPVDQVVKKIAYKKNRKYHMQFGQDHYEFKNVKQIILPFQMAKKILAKHYDIDVKYEPLEPEFTVLDNIKTPKQRNAVIAVMGHVDHGKTTIMDRLSISNIASREVEKITQKINVTEAQLSLGEDEDEKYHQVTFLDTPGHFHFFRMRNNAAHVADLVLLVVAADEGVQLQTEESVGCIEENELPVIACINKIDLVSNQQQKIQRIIKDIRSFVALQTCPIIPISAKDSKNLNQLQQSIINVLQSSSMQRHLEADFDSNTQAEGIVLESVKERGKGSVLRVLIKHGVLKRQDSFVCGMIHGSIKSIKNCDGKELKEAVPGIVVDLLYNNKSKNIDAPIEFGFFVMKADQAKQVIEQKELAMDFEECMVPSPEEFKAFEEQEKQKESSNIEEEEEDDEDNDKPGLKEYTEVNDFKKTIIVKADGAGSLTSIQDTVDEMDHVTTVRLGIGSITTKDLDVAIDKKCPIYGFNVKLYKRERQLAAARGIQIHLHTTVHGLVEDIEAFAVPNDQEEANN